ncbi:hypothetical protein SVIOM74S_02762 [Streptomyces violarus]
MATQQYEAGREEAEEQRARAQRAEELLDGQRRHIAALHEDLAGSPAPSTDPAVACRWPRR